jgi:hypothetical protein
LDNPLIGVLLALAATVVPLGLAGLLVEWRARKLPRFDNNRLSAAAGAGPALSSNPDQTDNSS